MIVTDCGILPEAMLPEDTVVLPQASTVMQVNLFFILEVRWHCLYWFEFYFGCVEARMCQDGGCEARAPPLPSPLPPTPPGTIPLPLQPLQSVPVPVPVAMTLAAVLTDPKPRSIHFHALTTLREASPPRRCYRRAGRARLVRRRLRHWRQLAVSSPRLARAICKGTN